MTNERYDNDEMPEPGEEQLHELIKEAGDKVRAENKEVKELHLKRLKEAVAEGVARRKNWQTT